MVVGGQLSGDWRDLLNETDRPRPWDPEARLPWSDPDFSERMLAVHLDPDTPLASRPPEVIAEHVAWFCGLLSGPSRVLDLGCGPGLYCHELARRGHEAVGVDFAPAPIRHAAHLAATEGLNARFIEADLRRLPVEALGTFDAVSIWYGEFNAFPADEIEQLLPVLRGLLKPGGLLVVEYQDWESFPRDEERSWECCEASVLLDRPHLWLREASWIEALDTEMNVHWTLAFDTGALSRWAVCHQAWRDDALEALLQRHGFGAPAFEPPLVGLGDRYEFPLLLARRSG